MEVSKGCQVERQGGANRERREQAKGGRKRKTGDKQMQCGRLRESKRERMRKSK